MSEEPACRFVTVSDGHINWDTSNEQKHRDAASTITGWHNDLPGGIDVVFIVGDMCQDEPDHQAVQDEFIDNLPDGIPYFAAYGNHEYIDPPEWPDWYGHDVDTTFEVPPVGFIVVQSAEDASDGHDFRTDEACADVNFIETELDNFEADPDIDTVFVMNHVAPFDHIRSHGNDCPDVRTQYSRDIVAGVFLGHDHTSNDVVFVDDTRYAYCNHMGDRGDGVEGVRLNEIYDNTD